MHTHSGNGSANGDDPGDEFGPEPGFLSSLDPLGLGRAWTRAMAGAAGKHPGRSRQSVDPLRRRARRGRRRGRRPRARSRHSRPVEPGPKDRRFRDPAWKENPAFFIAPAGLSALGRLVRDLVDAAELDEPDGEKARFLAEVVVDALAPTNFLATNPAAQKRALDTGGTSVVRGFATSSTTSRRTRAAAADRPRGVHGRQGPRGHPGQGRLPQRPDGADPVRADDRDGLRDAAAVSPPWINKYYIMDLAPGRSFVEWAVEHGHTVFAISYHNPDAADRDVTPRRLPAQRADRRPRRRSARSPAPSRRTSSGSASAAPSPPRCAPTSPRAGERPHRLDHPAQHARRLQPPRPPRRLHRPRRRSSGSRSAMAERGFLEASEMMGIFTFMRSNDLVWNYAVNNWLHGRGPPPVRHPRVERDSTRMPANDALLLSALVLPAQRASRAARWSWPGRRLDPAAIHGDVYVLAAMEDHIAPWEGSYLTTQVLPNADVRYVLSAAGPHRRHRQPAAARRPGTGPATTRCRPTREEWFAASIAARGIVVGGLGRVDRRSAPASGSRRRRMGSRKHRPVGGRPGDLRAREVMRSLAEVRIAYYSDQQRHRYRSRRRHTMPNTTIEYTPRPPRTRP